MADVLLLVLSKERELSEKLAEALEGLLIPTKANHGYTAVMDSDKDCNGCSGKMRTGTGYHDDGCLVGAAIETLQEYRKFNP